MNEIMTAINAELSRLTRARAILAGELPIPTARIVTNHNHIATGPKRVMSAEGRARIVAAQKLRWAKSRKAA